MGGKLNTPYRRVNVCACRRVCSSARDDDFLDKRAANTQPTADFIMSKAQYWMLNIVGGACALLILTCVVLSQLGEKSSQSLAATQAQITAAQAQINRGRQTQNTMQNLTVRVAQAAQSEPVLIELLNRHKLKVNLSVDGQVKQVP
jgi:hypothetical protein